MSVPGFYRQNAEFLNKRYQQQQTGQSYLGHMEAKKSHKTKLSSTRGLQEKPVSLLTCRSTPSAWWGFPGGSIAGWWGASSTALGTDVLPCPSAASPSTRSLWDEPSCRHSQRDQWLPQCPASHTAKPKTSPMRRQTVPDTRTSLKALSVQSCYQPAGVSVTIYKLHNLIIRTTYWRWTRPCPMKTKTDLQTCHSVCLELRRVSEAVHSGIHWLPCPSRLCRSGSLKKINK